MTEINYKSIVERLYKYCGLKMNDWENGFIDNLMNWDGEFTDNQKAVIIKLNRKYVVRR